MNAASELEGERSRLLKKWALEAGFDRAGVASLEPSRYGEAFERWLERGDHAQMTYLERRLEARLDPARLLEGGRSALCVALHYEPLTEDRDHPDGVNELWRGVARYARGDDYHQLMTERLERLAERVEQAFPGCRSRRYVDTGPILERELAQRAGLGRIGKNTNLLHREGSWFLIGELLLTLDLEPDEPLADLCGDCTLCLEACPTGALPEPYRLDSRRCISYWTIEHRGALPVEVREGLGQWIFGCDVCQEVCPWNSHRHRRTDVAGRCYDHPELEVPDRRRGLQLLDVLKLDRPEYLELFRRSPMKRAKLEGLRRNAVTALANGPRADGDTVSELLRTLSDGETSLRRHAAWALSKVTGAVASEDSRDALRAALRVEDDAEVRSELLSAIAQIEGLDG